MVSRSGGWVSDERKGAVAIITITIIVEAIRLPIPPRFPPPNQSMAKSSKMLNYINYRMRVTIQDK